jgi:hypothetical protein
MRKKTLALTMTLAAAVALGACYSSGTSTHDGGPDPDADAPDHPVDGDTHDPSVDPDLQDVEMDIPPDTDCDMTECIDCACQCPDGSWVNLWGGCYSVCEPIPECDPICPPDACPIGCTEPPDCPSGPPDGIMGGPCVRAGDCESGADCYTETVESFDGELYISWMGGSCVLSGGGSEGCDPADPETCPDGSVCIYLGDYMGYEWHGCFDACSPADASGTPYDWACGCREGYSCNLSYGACFPGCSNDRECCELWNDANGDGRRERDEVTFFPDCDGTCDNDLGPDCMASYTCIYAGDDEARIGSPCEQDFQCTPGGMCLSGLWTDPYTGEPYYPGGYCTIMDCQLDGRDCAPHGGVCANMGSFDSPSYMCLVPCEVGTSPETPGYPCRTAPAGEVQACMPVWEGTFIEEPPAGMDGYCWFGNFPGGSKGLGETCSGDGECASPLGLGMCIDYFDGSVFCTTSCNEKVVIEDQICGPVGSDGVATGVCAWNMCWQGCNSLDQPPGANGCTGAGMACSPLYLLGSTTYVPEGAARPQGLCLPPCDSDAWCHTYFGPSRTCDTVTRSCR